MQKCLVLCKTLDVLTEFIGQNRGQMGKIVDKWANRGQKVAVE